jgi:hypothetical protein
MYQVQNNTLISAATYINKTVMMDLIQGQNDPDWHAHVETVDDFYNLSQNNLKRLVEKHVQPRDPSQFVTLLFKNVHWSGTDSSINISYFKGFWKALVQYIYELKNLYLFLSHHNQTTVPLNWFKGPGSLLDRFTKAIPCSFASIVRNKMDPAIKQENFLDFLSDFKTVADEFRVQGESINRTQDIFKFSTKVPDSLTETTRVKAPYFNRQQPKLHNLNGAEATPPEIENSEEELEMESVEEGEDSLLYLAPKFDSRALQPNAILTRPTDSTTGERACFRMLFDGVCKNDGCNYSHDPKFLEKTCQEKILQLQKSKFKR